MYVSSIFLPLSRLKEVDYGITPKGLIRNGPSQHVKDDRRAVNDIANYVLGWSTEAKVRALSLEFEKAERLAAEAGGKAKLAGDLSKKLLEKVAAIDAVLSVERYADVDYEGEQKSLLRLQQEKEELEASSDKRRALQSQLKTVKDRIEARKITIGSIEKKIGAVERDQEANQTVQCELRKLTVQSAEFDWASWTERLTALQEEKHLTISNIRNVAQQASDRLRRKVDHQTGLINAAVKEMLPMMSDFLRDYPEESADKKAQAEYSGEYVALQERLRKDDLPKHEQEFEKFLSLNLIGDVAMFSTKLAEHEKDIRLRVDVVNRALRNIQYSPGTHVQIVIRNKGISDETSVFRSELRSCLSGGLNPSPEDRVRIFGQIRELIAKFDKDENWTRRVTDSRNWLEFGVREIADVDGREVNYYAASSGKSGGQKTKLAFTILASAITAQYGLVGSGNESSTFRFVIIDEAFARTDEGNSERGLKLFQSLGLQLLVVSPFDAKSRIVEDYVDSFHLCVNPGGNNSHVRQATRVEYEGLLDRPTN